MGFVYAKAQAQQQLYCNELLLQHFGVYILELSKDKLFLKIVF